MGRPHLKSPLSDIQTEMEQVSDRKEESDIWKIIKSEKGNITCLYECMCLCLCSAVAKGSGSPLSQAVLPVELGRFLLPGGIRLWKTFKAG